ncbi:MAG: glutathione S-transferase family protein [Nannocystaceae bacterium]
MNDLVLYQFELCPYCHKVRAGLELKGLSYRRVEVNPISKRELDHLPPSSDGRRRVPVLEYKGEARGESSDILRWLDQVAPGDRPLHPLDPDQLDRANEIDAWLDNDLIKILPTVLYGTWSESIRAAKLTAKTSNFSRIDNLKVGVFGSIIMKTIAKRILRKRGGGKTGLELFHAELTRLETWLADSDFLGDDAPHFADAGVHGALTCVRQFPAFEHVRARPKLEAWYERVDALRRTVHPASETSA